MTLTGFESYSVELTPRLQSKIKDLLWLLETYTTYEKPRHSDVLEKELKLTGPEIRKIAAHCILNHIAPVGTDERGFYLCANYEQAELASRHRIQRGTANLAVGYALKNYFPPEEQGSFEL